MAGKKFVIPIAYQSDKAGLDKAGKDVDGFAGKLVALAAVAAAAWAVDKVIDFGKQAILAAEGVATANARIENVANSMGVFGTETKAVTDRLLKYAKQNELVWAVDEKVIKGTQAKLLTFKNLAVTAGTLGGAFDRATKAAVDMAATGFGDAESNAVQLGKALEDPIKGITALTRSGITFNEEQKNLIKTLVESGNVLEAQDMILSAIETQVGGTAEATANASDKMQLAFGNISEKIGTALLPAFNEATDQLIKFIDEQIEKPEFNAFLDEMVKIFEDMLAQLPLVLENLSNFSRDTMPVLQAAVGLVNEALGLFVSLVLGVDTGEASSDARDFADAMNELAGSINSVSDGLNAIKNWWNSLPQELKFLISPWLSGGFNATVNPKAPTVVPLGGGRELTLAEGGIVMPRPGGVKATIAEAGEAEAVIPLSKMGSMGTTVVINGNVGYDAAELAREIARRQAQVNALSGINRLVGVS